MKIIRAYGGKAELHCAYGGGWTWYARVKRDTLKTSGGVQFTNIVMAGSGDAPTMREARRRALRVLRPCTDAEQAKADEMFCG